MKQLPISLIIIAHNEENNLPRCLDAVAPWVSEIIAVINDCNDKTKEVLESYGAKVYEHDWQGSNEQKRRALGYATQPWVLSLDADEVVSPTLAQSIQQFIEKDSENFAGAYNARKTWLLGKWIKHGDWYPNHIYRLFKRSKGSFEGGKDHEKVCIDGPIKKLEGDLLHYSFKSIDEMITKMPRFGRALLQHQLERGKKWSLVETLFRAFWRFFRCYFVRLGFLDGYPGLFIAINQGFYTFYRYSCLYEHEKESQHTESSKQDLANVS